jgi:hypothetical protein
MDGVRGFNQGQAGSLSQQMRYFLQALREVRGVSAPPEQPADTETTLNYKLDMDERGVLKSASPGQSIRAVTGQEQMNVHRLSAEATARGEDVVSVDVDYKTAIVDGKLVILAGHTEVTSKPAGGKPVGGGLYKVEQPQPQQPATAPAEAAASYRAIGEANRQAARSLDLIEGGDDGTLRCLSEGLCSDE